MSVGVISYGMGNVRSVLNAFAHLGIPAHVIETPDELDQADRILLPGVGAFGAAMARLEKSGLRGALDRAVQEQGKPLLGICLGMQLLAETGTEFGNHEGLGYLPGRVEMIDRAATDLILPHMGWNSLNLHNEIPLLDGVEPNSDFYFVHSFQLHAANDDIVNATTEYGGQITAVVSRDNVMGTQFHPEKSQDIGLRILANFAAIPC